MAGYIGPAPVPQATQNREAFTATSGQTSFATSGYTPQFIDVYLNGVKLAAADYTATNGSDVVLASGATVGDILEVVAFSAFTVADQAFTGTTTVNNLSVTGNATFADNVKAIFGAGSDLQIYHDGAHSYLYETGTGEFRIKTNGNIIQFLDNSNNYLIKATVGAEVGLYFNTAQKLATTSTGVDVKNVASGANAKLNITTGSTGGGTSEILFSDNTTGRGRIYYDHGSNPEELHIETTGTDALVIDNSQNITIPNGNVGIGTDSPNYNLTSYKAGANANYIQVANGSTGPNAANGTLFGVDASGNGVVTVQGSFDYITSVAGSEAMRIDSSGNVGIGTDSPFSVNGKNLHVQASSSNARAILESSGGSGRNWAMQSATDGSLNFYDLTGSSEAMRIDSSGNLLVGHTSADVDTLVDNNTVGITLKANGEILAASTVTVATLERENSDGDIIEFRKDGATVGSIQSRAGLVSTIILDPRTGSLGTGITGSGANLSPTDGSGAEVDARNDIGTSDYRFKDLYLSGNITMGGRLLDNTHIFANAANTTEYMRIDSSGHAIIPAGVTLGTSAGTYAAANTLDDYEEGTWTPTASGSTSGTMSITVSRARYVKIGQVVTASATIGFSSGSTGVGGLRIFGLPGLPATLSQVNLEAHGACMFDAVNFGQTFQNLCSYIYSGVNYLNFYGTVDNGSWNQLQVDHFVNGTSLQFTTTYQTNN